MRTEKISSIVGIAVLCIVAIAMAPFSAYGVEELIVNDSNGNAQFVVTDSGQVTAPTATGMIGVGTSTPAALIDVVGNGIKTNIQLTKYGGNPGATFRAARGTLSAPTQVTANSLLGGFVAAGYTADAGWGANEVGIYFYAEDNFTSTTQGTYVQIQTTPAGGTVKSPVATFNSTGASIAGTVYASGGFSQGSSRTLKDNIHELTSDKAMDTIKNLVPVTYNYRNDNQGHVGFIAEDVPALVASNDRKSLSPMDIVAVLTKVVQREESDSRVTTENSRVTTKDP